MDLYTEVLKHLDGVAERGGYSSALCVWHDDHSPSLMVYPDGYYCMACGARGSLKKLLNKVKGAVPKAKAQTHYHILDLPDNKYEMEELADTAHNMLLSYDVLAWYLRKRGVANRIIPQKIGYYNGWYSIPIYDLTKGFEGVVFRAGPDKQGATGLRYYIPQGQSAMLYVPNWQRILETDFVVVVFGIFDALALEELEIPACTPTNGMKSIYPDMLSGFRKHILVLPDEGEEEVGAKLVAGLGWRGRLINANYPDGCKDPADCLEQGQRLWLDDIIRQEDK